MSEWIKCSERLPEFTGDFGGFALVSDDVIAFSESKGEVSADYSTRGWCDSDGDILEDVTRWKPISMPEAE